MNSTNQCENERERSAKERMNRGEDKKRRRCGKVPFLLLSSDNDITQNKRKKVVEEESFPHRDIVGDTIKERTNKREINKQNKQIKSRKESSL